jgi:isohexenylglutaconyl-CoA hydratase
VSKLDRTRDGSAARWTLNHPATRNALDEEVVESLHAACDDAASDPSLRFIVLSGAAGAFCAGGHLGGFASQVGQPLAAGRSDPLVASNLRFGDLLHRLVALPQLLIAAIDGPAMAGGFGLVCCADFVVATPRASFATPEVTLGIAPAQIAPFVWSRLGDRTARQLLLEGRRFDALQALQIGLVDEIAEDLDTGIRTQLDRLKAAAPDAVAATKRLLHALGAHAVKDLRPQAAQAFAASLRSPEAGQGLAAFAKRQPPPWAR